VIRWTAQLLDRARAQADAGRTVEQAAKMLQVSEGSLSVYAGKHKIHFHGRKTQSKRARKAEAPVLDWLAPADRALVATKQALAQEIALARDEMATAPLYRKWPL
jgi:hypothetical protein